MRETFEETLLWNIIGDYCIGPVLRLRDDAPPEVVAARDRLMELSWGPEAIQ
jgi:hypothetical protein